MPTREQEAAFAAQVQIMQERMTREGVDPETGAVQGAAHASQRPEPNAIDRGALSLIESSQSARVDGRRPYEHDDSYRQRVESARVAAFAGKSLADVQKILNGEAVAAPAQPQQPQQPAPKGEGTPAQRLEARLTSGDVIMPGELTPELWQTMTAGYKLDRLPEGFGLTADDAADLAAARKAGLSQAQVDAIIADRVRGQS